MAIWTVNRYRDFVAQVPEYAMFLIDREGVAQTWNAGVGRVLGYEEAEVVGLDVARLFTPEDQAGGVPALELAEAERTGSADDDRWMQKRDGTHSGWRGAPRPCATTPVRSSASARSCAIRPRCVTPVRELLPAGAPFIQKPFTPDQFLAAVEHALREAGSALPSTAR